MDWRQSLIILKKQFEAVAARSRGLHHLFVEVDDHERDRAAGPKSFAGRHFVSRSTLIGSPPRFREVRAGESLDAISEQAIVRDGSGRPRAVFVPQRLRSGYFFGDGDQLAPFESLAQAASQVLTDVPELRRHERADDLVDLFRKPRGGIRYVFGEVDEVPAKFIAQGWNAGVYVEKDGVVIDVPISDQLPGVEHWLLLLHRLSWRRIPGSPLYGQRIAWSENTTVPFDWVEQRVFTSGVPEQWRELVAQIPATSYYSMLGDEKRPLDVNLASSFAIQLLLSAKRDEATRAQAKPAINYSSQEWAQRVVPAILPGTTEECRRSFNPRVVLLTATPLERDTVLKNMEPVSGQTGIIKAFHENNTFYVGMFGSYPVAMCMSEMGSSGRDSAQTVAGEAIRLWKPTALISVGIAFGGHRQRQKIGDVLVAEKVIAYEPARIGAEETIPRGHQYQAGPTLYNRFRNAPSWSFVTPESEPCSIHYGPILSGEKLVDNATFKADLFSTFRNAIGGDMEGAGIAAAAERAKCEWIIVKGICDWADGTKDDGHQRFAAAAAVSLVRNVLSQAGAVPGAIFSAEKYTIHDEIVKRLRKNGIICPWEQFMPDHSRDKVMGAIALLRHEGLAKITVRGHAYSGQERATFHEILQCGPAFNGMSTDKGVMIVDEYQENIVGQYMADKRRWK